MERGATGAAVTALHGGGDGQSPLRTPPHNFEAEMALLGAVLANNHAYERVSEFLRPQHFSDVAHQRIYAALSKLIERGQLANPITLKTYFEQDGTLTDVGGAQYLARLAGSVVTIINAADYGHLIYDLYLRRELIGLGEDMVNRAFAAELDDGAKQQIEAAETLLFNLAESGDPSGGFQDLGRALTEAILIAEAAFKRDSHVTGVTTGLADIDKKLGGLHPSDLVILAGRPGMGKTALATKIAFEAARSYREERAKDGTVTVIEGAKVAFFSLEMSAEQLATRILAEQTEVSSDRIRRGEVRAEDFPRFVQASQDMNRIPLFIDDTPAISVATLRARARRLKRQQGLGLIVIDYLQLLDSAPGERPENRVQQLSAITRGLKALAKELHVPVVALSQLSRAVEQREDKRPQLSDLRESGSIEQDADVVMFIYRQAYYEREPMRHADDIEEKFQSRLERWHELMGRIHNLAELIVSKQRHGPVGTVKLFFDGNFTKFGNWEREDDGGS